MKLKLLITGLALLVSASPSYAGGIMMMGGGVSDSPPAATNWLNDATLVSYYQLESGALTTDYKSNTTLVNGSGTPTANTTDFVESAASANFSRSGTDLVYVTPYASCAANFPTIGTGDGEITVAMWVRITKAGAYYVFSLKNTGAEGTVLAIRFDASNYPTVLADGSSEVTATSTAALTTNTWALVALSYSDTSNTLAVYVRSAGEGSSTWTTATADIGTLDDIGGTSGIFVLGGSADGEAFYGQLDAVAVFNGKALTQSELDGVFANGWDGDGW